MPLKQTEYGGICPLGKFRLDPAAPGSYTADPVEKCINCNFSDMSIKRFDLEKICKCPSDMDWNEYDKLRKRYLALKKQIGSSQETEINIKLMEFNIEDGGDQVSLDKVIDIIKLAKPDIIAIEEVWGKLPELANKLGFPHYNARSQLISKYPIIDSCQGNGVYMFIEVKPNQVIAVSNVHLPSDPYGPDILHTGATFEHLSKLEHKLRVAALEKQLDILPKLVKSGIPVFLTGDFNVPSHLDCNDEISKKCFSWPISKKLLKLGFHDAFRKLYPDPKIDPGFTWWANRPQVKGWNPSDKDIHDRIDFIYYAGPVIPSKFKIIGESAISPPWPSDHRAIIGTFSVQPIPMPILISTNKRLYNIDDKVEIRYCLSDRQDLKIIIKNLDTHKIIDEYNINKLERNGTLIIKIDTKGAFEATLQNLQNKIICYANFFVKNKDDTVILKSKDIYGHNEPIIATWQNGPGNRFDFIAIKNLDNKSELQSIHTGTKINGRIIFTKENVDKWPLPSGNYEMLYMIDDSPSIVARTTFIIKN